MKTKTKEVKIVSLSIRNLKADIVKKAKSFWARIKPKIVALHNKMTTIFVKLLEKLADDFLNHSDKILDKLAKRVGIDPDIEANDASNIDDDIVFGSGSINDVSLDG